MAHRKVSKAKEANESVEQPWARKPTHCYVGRTSCGCAVAVRTDLGCPRTARDVSAMIRQGMTIERMSLKDFQKIKFGCKCPKEAVPA